MAATCVCVCAAETQTLDEGITELLETNANQGKSHFLHLDYYPSFALDPITFCMAHPQFLSLQ